MSDVKSSMAIRNLVIFLIYLGVLGLLMTLAIYYAAVFPAQHAAAAPTNSVL